MELKIKKIYNPDPCLIPYVSHYLHLKIKILETEKGFLCSFPTGNCMLNIIFSDDLPEFIFHDGSRLKTRSLLSGILTNGVTVGNAGTFNCVMTYLTPLGAYHLFGVPQSEYVNRFINPEWISKGWGSLVEDFCLQKTVSNKIQRLENFLKKLLSVSEQMPCLYDAIAGYITLNKGKIRLDNLVQEFAITSRTLDRNFYTFSGLTPKSYANQIRLGLAYQMLMFQPKLTIHDIVYLLGYYDQSHLTREFAGYANLSPAELRQDSGRILFPKILAD